MTTEVILSKSQSHKAGIRVVFVGWVETQLSRAVASSGLGLDPAYENQTEDDAPPELKALMGQTLSSPSLSGCPGS